MKSMYHINQIPAERRITKFIRRIVFGKNVLRSVCGSRKVIIFERRYRCHACRTKFPFISHTWLKGMELSYEIFWCVLWTWTASIPVAQTRELAGLSREAPCRWHDLFREHLSKDHVILGKIVQLDEAYFKGWSLVMGKERGTRKIAFMLFKGNAERHHAVQFLEAACESRIKALHDGAWIYRGIEHWWPVEHQWDIHKRFEFGKTSEIQGSFCHPPPFILDEILQPVRGSILSDKAGSNVFYKLNHGIFRKNVLHELIRKRDQRTRSLAAPI